MTIIRVGEEYFFDESKLHNEFSKIMGFFSEYGNNWDAWIDCMSYINDPQEKMTKIHVAKDENLEIEILSKDGNTYYKQKAWGNFTAAVAAVNGRLADSGSSTRIIITEKNGNVHRSHGQ